MVRLRANPNAMLVGTSSYQPKFRVRPRTHLTHFLAPYKISITFISMRKVILYIATSLDGFIAGPDGNIDWLHDPDFEIPNEDFGYQTFYDSIDTTLMGNATYQQVLGFDVPFPYEGKTNYVFTRTASQEKDEHVTFISEDIPGFVKQLKEQPGKDIWLVGGGQINSILVEHDLIDQIILSVIPVKLEEGIPLFNDLNMLKKFGLEKSTSYENGFVQMVYGGTP